MANPIPNRKVNTGKNLSFARKFIHVQAWVSLADSGNIFHICVTLTNAIPHTAIPRTTSRERRRGPVLVEFAEEALRVIKFLNLEYFLYTEFLPC